MVIKCKKPLDEYDYLVMFDLASHNTGVCLWNLKANRPEDTFIVVSNKVDGNFVFDLYQQLENLFQSIQNKGISLANIFVSKEAMPAQLRGGSSTVQTFIALAKAHAILDLYLEQHGIDTYDYVGVYPASTHAYLKKVLGLDSKASVDKKDIKKYIHDNYGLDTQTFDESDAVFLAQTLINSKWNKDIEEKIKDIKRHKKTLKMAKAIQDCDNQISSLQSMLH